MASYIKDRQFIILSLLVLAAFLLRIGLFLAARNTHYPDEIFQVTEPAHRLLFGTGYVSWEWIVGARSWLWPGFVAGLMALGHLAGDDPDRIRLPVFLFMAAASTVPVLCGILWGRRFGGMTGAVVTGTLGAVWVDEIYMAAHPLSDVIAADCLAAFLYLACPHRPAEGWRRLFWAGVLAGTTLALRVQLGPALAVAAIMVCGWRAPRGRWLPFLLGSAIPVALLGALDWVTLGQPFQSVVVNIRMNVIERVSGDFGVSAWYWLIGFYGELWGGALPAFLLAVFAGARKLPVLAATAGAIFVTFSLFDHKEYRFAYPAVPLLVTLAGLGTTEMVLFVQRQRLAIFTSPSSVTFIAVAFWAATSSALALSPLYQSFRITDRAFIDAFRQVAARADLCGVALYRISIVRTPGNSGLPPHTPLYQTDETRLAADAPAFNALIAWPRAVIAPETGFTKAGCFGEPMDGAPHLPDVCVWVRSGSCTPGAASLPPVNWPARLAARAGDQKAMEEDSE